MAGCLLYLIFEMQPKFPEQQESTMWSSQRCYWDQKKLAKWENPNQIIIQVNKLKMKAFPDAFDKG